MVTGRLHLKQGTPYEYFEGRIVGCFPNDVFERVVPALKFMHYAQYKV